MVLGLGTMVAVNLTLLGLERDVALVLSMTAKTLCIGLIPLTLVYSRRLLADWLACLVDFVEFRDEDGSGWFAHQVQKLFVSRINILLGILVGCLILAFEYQDGAFRQQSAWALGVVLFASLLMTVLAGIALVVMVRGAMLISRVGTLPIYVTASPYGVLRTGTMLAEAFSAATVVYLIALCTMVLRTWNQPTLPILTWAISVAVLYVAMFILPQWTIHKRMVRFKRERLRKIERSLKEHSDAFDAAPTKAESEIVEALRKRRDEVESLPEWPFNWKNFTAVLGMAASSTLPVVFKVAFASISAWVVPVMSGAKSP
ncbi:MAG: hypothetical protein HYU41_01495 [Candidatus Rokubacteria bacterium]|nr:hypothetical protein [Candidatus Rokubacteria bacterium]